MEIADPITRAGNWSTLVIVRCLVGCGFKRPLLLILVNIANVVFFISILIHFCNSVSSVMIIFPEIDFFSCRFCQVKSADKADSSRHCLHGAYPIQKLQLILCEEM